MLEIRAEGRPFVPGEPIPQSEYRTADPGYFRASGIPLLKGRDFTTTDVGDGARVVILNQTLANLLLPDRDPIGQRVGCTFLPLTQGGFPSGGVVIRSNVDPMGISIAARAIVRSIAPEAPIENVLTIDEIRDESVGPRRLNAILVGSFGLLALLVAAIGIAAVLAFSVSARTNEIGMRMSLGAHPGQVQWMVMREGGTLVVMGLVFGVVGSLLLARLMQGLLFGVAPHDPLTLVTVVTVMAAIGLGTCWVPAARASRIDPSEALRAQ